MGVLFGVALSLVGEPARPLLATLERLSAVVFRIVHMLMRLAPIGAFGAIGIAMMLALKAACLVSLADAGDDDVDLAVEAAKAAQEFLNAGTTLFQSGMDTTPIRELGLMTTKPFLYVFNCDSDELADEPLKQRLRAFVAQRAQ